jgi:hypothetical protein
MDFENISSLSHTISSTNPVNFEYIFTNTGTFQITMTCGSDTTSIDITVADITLQAVDPAVNNI